MSTKILLTMPQPGETITQGTVVRWMAKVGDQIKEGQYIVELETEKAVFEYESPYEGKLVEICAQEGETIPVGNPIAVFEVEDSKAATYFMLGIGEKADEKSKVQSSKPKMKSPLTSQEGGPSVKLSPLIRKLIQEHGIELEELSQVRGTGPGARITKENILKYIEGRGTACCASMSDDIELIPCSPVRVRIAENMMQSKRTIPHAHTSAPIDITPVVEYRQRVKKDFEFKNGIPLGYLPLIFPSLIKAIQKYPLVNASYHDQGEKKFIAMNKRVHLGVAVDTDRGLYTPVVANAQGLNFLQFAKNLEDVIQRTQNKKVKVSELTGMTFTFNNYGYYGTRVGVQIILPPQSTTLGMGRVEKRPWVVGDEVKVRWISDFTLAFDHRIIDGRDAGLFLEALKESLENFSESSLS